METMTASTCVIGDFERTHKIRFRVVESVRFLSETVLQETIVSDNIISLNIPFPFPFLLRPITLSLHIHSELSEMGLGDSLTDLINTVSSYVLNLARRDGRAMSIDADVHIVTDVQIDGDGAEMVQIRPPYWAIRPPYWANGQLTTTELMDGVGILDDIHGSRSTTPSRNRGGPLRAAQLMGGVGIVDDIHGSQLMDGVGIVDDIHESVSTPPSRNRGATGYVINRLKTENRFNGENIPYGEVDDCAICLEEQSGVKDLIKLPCSHLFHSTCICTWLEKEHACPICRRKSSTTVS